MPLSKRRKVILGAIFVAASTAGFFWYAVWQENTARRSGILTLAFMDVGQGDAIFVEAPNGNQMIIDGGPNAAILRELGNLMPFYDRTIDVLVITNPDTDHYAGFLDVLERYEVAMVIESGVRSDTTTYAAFERAVAAEGADKVIAKRGMNLVLDPENGANFEIIFPDQDVSSGFSSNDGSIVARLVYGNTSIMFTGDTTQKVEKRLLRTEATPLKSDILKAAHHGSKTSSFKDFVAAVSPAHAVISVGRNNRYKHPSPETLETLTALKVPVLRTDKMGTIIFESDGKVLKRRR